MTSHTRTKRTTSANASKRGHERPLRPEEKKRLALLALPTFALSLSLTIVSTYLSTVTRRYTHQTAVIGVIVGGEGVMALWVPLIAGAWSDTLRTRIGGRLPLLLAGALPAAAALALIGFMHSLVLVALVAAVFFALLGDRFGRIRVVRIALVGYGLGFLVLVFTTSRPLIAAAVPFVAIGGGAVMTMAYAILMPLMPKHEHGALTGFYSASRGVGITLGPILAGVLIAVTAKGPFGSTHGFQAMWIVCAAAALGSLLFLRKLAQAERDRKALREQ